MSFFLCQNFHMRLSNFSCSVFLGKFGGFHPKSLSMKQMGVCSCQKMQYLKRGIFRGKKKPTPPRCIMFSHSRRTRCSLKRHLQLKKMLQWENFHPLWLHLFPPALRERKVFFQTRVVMCFDGWTRKCIDREKKKA